MKKILESKGRIISIAVIFVVALPVITNILGLISTPITEGNTESWISFFGSYFGGIVGGILGALIAFGIAKYQIDKQKEYENKKAYTSQLPTLIKVQLELDVISNNLNVSKNIFLGEKDNTFPIRTDLRLSKINSEGYVDISNITDAELQVDLIKLRQFHNSLVENMAFNFNENSVAIEKNHIEIEKLERKKNRNRVEENKLQELFLRHRELVSLDEITISNKEFSISGLEDGIKQVKKILITVEETYKKAKEISAELNVML